MKKLLWALIFSLLACNTTRVVESHSPYPSPQSRMEKLLIIGMIPDREVRKNFETRLQKAFQQHQVEAMASYDLLLNDRFYSGESTKRQLDTLEKDLLAQGFDAVLLSKLIQVEKRKGLLHTLSQLVGNNRSFKSDYFSNQAILQGEEGYGESKIYHTQTSIYRLPENRQRELIWEGEIDLKNPKKQQKTIKEYVTLLIARLKWDGILPY